MVPNLHVFLDSEKKKNRIIVFIYTHSKIIIACLSLKDKIKSLDLIPFAHRRNEKYNCI